MDPGQVTVGRGGEGRGGEGRGGEGRVGLDKVCTWIGINYWNALWPKAPIRVWECEQPLQHSIFS